MNTNLISKATLGRIPIYIQYLKELPDENGDMIRNLLSVVCGEAKV